MKKLFLAIFITGIAIPSFSQQTGTFTDNRDGKTYKTITIGNQVWMAENLAFKVEDGCYAYDNNQDNVAIYGYLYKWESAQQACPSGWRLPTLEEYKALLESLGGIGSGSFQPLLPTGNSGFSALLGGWFPFVNMYKNLGGRAYFWTSTRVFLDAYSLVLDGKRKKATFLTTPKTHGHSVRCVKDK